MLGCKPCKDGFYKKARGILLCLRCITKCPKNHVITACDVSTPAGCVCKQEHYEDEFGDCVHCCSNNFSLRKKQEDCGDILKVP